MDARVALLFLWTAFVLLTAELNWIDAAKVYTNTWAVQVNGGPGEADRIAREHGFVNHGPVSSTSVTLLLLLLLCTSFFPIYYLPTYSISLYIPHYTTQPELYRAGIYLCYKTSVHQSRVSENLA